MKIKAKEKVLPDKVGILLHKAWGNAPCEQGNSKLAHWVVAILETVNYAPIHLRLCIADALVGATCHRGVSWMYVLGEGVINLSA